MIFRAELSQNRQFRFIFVFLPQFLVFFRKFACHSWETTSFYGEKGRFIALNQ